MSASEDLTFTVYIRYFSQGELDGSSPMYLTSVRGTKRATAGWYRQEASAEQATRYFGPFLTAKEAMTSS